MSNLKILARRLRANQTEAEKKLWYFTRRRQLNGMRFRRQVPINNYIVDFLCHEHKLIIELDGGQHSESLKDIERTKTIELYGYHVLRYWNNDVMNNIEGVLQDVLNTITPPPYPLPKGGRITLSDNKDRC